MLVGGNHDHGLVAGWIDGAPADRAAGLPRPRAADRRRRTPARSPRGSPSAPRPRASSVAYPGLWLRDDVYAIHGHYSDLHTTVPTFERLAAGAMARWVVHLPERRGHRRRLRGRARAALRVDARARPALRERRRDRRRAARRRAPGSRSRARGAARTRCAPPRSAAATRAAVACVNALGLGPLDRDLSGPGAAPRRPARHARGAAAPRRRPRRGCCSATRTAPGRGRATTSAEWTTPARHAAASTPAAGCYQPHFLSADAEPLALLAGHRDPGRRRAARPS